MSVKLNPAQVVSKQFTEIKVAVNGFNESTPLAEIQEAKSNLESMQVKIRSIIQGNPGAVMVLALADRGIPGLINRCSALIPAGAAVSTPVTPAPVVQTTTTTTTTTDTASAVFERGFKNRVSANDENMIFLTSGRAIRPQGSVRLPTPRTRPPLPTISEPIVVVPQPSAPVITEIKVKCQIPFGHSLKIHGQGGDLDWIQGKELVKVDNDTYAYRMENVTGKVEYKLVLDGQKWEDCPNRSIEAEKSQEIVPALFIPTVPVIVNFGDSSKKLFVRGTGPGMSWEKGIELKSVQGKFVLETNTECGNFEFKVLINDQQWSNGENFKAENGRTVEITPNF